jgi:hypothetical protein
MVDLSWSTNGFEWTVWDIVSATSSRVQMYLVDFAGGWVCVPRCSPPAHGIAQKSFDAARERIESASPETYQTQEPEEQRAAHDVVLMRRVLEVSRSGYYKWRAGSEKRQVDGRLLLEIRVVHRASEQTYGSPRVWRELRANGVEYLRSQVKRLMRMAGGCEASRTDQCGSGDRQRSRRRGW